MANGLKTLRKYSDPLDLNDFGKDWMNEKDDLWGIDEELGKMLHHDIMPKDVINKLRKADLAERKAGEIVEWKIPKNMKK
jgi:hypothetical protein